MGPELGVVLAYPYALLLVATLVSRYTQLLLGVALLYVVLGVEYREMLTQNLLFPVAFYVLGARVPAYDTTLRIKHEAGVVLNPFHQEPKALLALPEYLLGPSGPFAVILQTHHSYSLAFLQILDTFSHTSQPHIFEPYLR